MAASALLSKAIVEKIKEVYPKVKVRKYVAANILINGVPLSLDTLERWYKRGHKHAKAIEENPELQLSETEQLELELYSVMRVIHTDICVNRLGILEKQAENVKNASSNQWLLQRLDPDVFGERGKTDVTITGEVGVNVGGSLLSTIKDVQLEVLAQKKKQQEETNND